MKRKAKWLWAVGGLAVVAVVVGVSMKSGASDGAPTGALTYTVKRGDLAIEVVETGRIQPRERAEIKSKVPGQAVEVLVEEGLRVRKGQLLIRLDPTDYLRDVARAQAELALAKSAEEYAALSLQRKRTALESRGASQAEVDFAANELKSKAAAVRMAQVALASAQDRLRYTEIVAPFDGTIIERGIQAGEVVTPGVQATFEGRPLLTLADLGALVVRAELNQIDAAKVQLGAPARLTLDAVPGRTYLATVTKVAPAAVRSKNNRDLEVFPVEATLLDADGAIKPGMTAELRIGLEHKPKVLAVPIEAVVRENGKSYVNRILLAKGKRRTEKVEVHVGARNDRDFEVVDGVTEGDDLIIEPESAAKHEAKL